MKNNFVDKVAFTLPWLGSLVPAIMTFENVQARLGFNMGEAGVIGVVVEGLGFAAITTTLDIFEQDQADGRQWSGQFWAAVGGTAVYVAVIVLVNAVLDPGDVWRKVTLGLLALLALVGGLMVGLRNQLGKRRVVSMQATDERKQADERARIAAETREREEREHAWQMDQERVRLAHEEQLARIDAANRRKLAKIEADSRRMVAEQAPDDAGGERRVSGKSPERPGRWADVSPDDYRWISDAPVGEIVARYGLGGRDPERKGREWKGYARLALADLSTDSVTDSRIGTDGGEQ